MENVAKESFEVILKEILEAIQPFADEYDKFLCTNAINTKEFRTNKKYAMIKFFDVWGLERRGSTKKQKIAVHKFLAKYFCELNSLKKDSLKEKYEEFLQNKGNVKKSPVVCESIASFDVEEIITLVAEDKIEEAYEKLIKLNGVAYKIATFFLRDASYFFVCQSKEKLDVQKFVYLFPIDVWVRNFIDGVFKLGNINIADITTTGINCPKNMDKDDFKRSVQFCRACHALGYDLRVVNFCIWYFCSQCVGNEKRLECVIAGGVEKIKEEICLALSC